MVRILLMYLGVVSATACGSPSEPDPSPDPIVNFETLWREFDERYSFFILKGIDWDALYNAQRPRVTQTTTPQELFDIMTDLLSPLKDGHVRLQAPFATSSYSGWYDRFPDNYNGETIEANYLTSGQTTPSGVIRYGRLEAGIGYVRIAGFGGDGWADEIDVVLGALADVSGLVLDIRHNGGGSDRNGEAVAGRFAERTQVYRRIRWRDGPNHDDFGDPIDDDFSPVGNAQFGGPVALLTNRRVFSAAEGFVLAMRTIPLVVTVGDTTGGGSANPIELQLPNRWTYTVSRWIVFDLNDRPFEGVGIGPDIWVTTTPEDQLAGRDPILERAIAHLTGVSARARSQSPQTRSVETATRN